MKRFQDLDHWVVLAWLAVTGLSLFGLVVCWQEGLIGLLVDSDRSHISLVIGMLYLVGCVHCARRAFFLADETDYVSHVAGRLDNRSASVDLDDASEPRIDGEKIDPGSVLAEHLVLVIRGNRVDGDAEHENSSATGILVARSKGSHDFGWFLVDSLVKLGLLGTIVGFILMLGSVADTASLDVNTMQKVLKQMSNGMGTALYTTLAGLVGSMSLGLQYLLVDKGADNLIERVLRLSETRLLLR